MMARAMRGAGLLIASGAVVLGGSAVASADADAQGAAVGSPGVLSGNVLQIPVNIPINACGNSVNVLALLNPAFGNTCANL
ncbi:chaplin [Streptomyces sp. NPDC046860]|uniref:chaplin n=1 Tax=Streptomyces sp. NPDC046860 TaxID=3154495 RepID=UPI0033FE0743